MRLVDGSRNPSLPDSEIECSFFKIHSLRDWLDPRELPSPCKLPAER
jgi:hypothetical protein